MEKDIQEKIFGLMAVTEDQQQAVNQAIEALKAEQQELARERAKLSAAIEALLHLPGQVADRLGSEAAQKLSGVSTAAFDVEGALRRAMIRFSRQWRLLIGLVGIGTIAVMLLTGWLTNLWLQQRVAQQRAELQMLQSTADSLVQRGGAAQLTHCGAQSRLCVRVDEKAGPHKGGYWILSGY